MYTQAIIPWTFFVFLKNSVVVVDKIREKALWGKSEKGEGKNE
jgi:hypothetical protein